jgi:hypothetical protein
MPGLKNHSHAALTQSSLQLVARIEDGFADQRWRRGIAVLRTVVDFIGETAPTGWTFFHLLARYKAERRQEGFKTQTRKDGSRGLILTAAVGSKQPTKWLPPRL